MSPLWFHGCFQCHRNIYWCSAPGSSAMESLGACGSEISAQDGARLVQRDQRAWLRLREGHLHGGHGPLHAGGVERLWQPLRLSRASQEPPMWAWRFLKMAASAWPTTSRQEMWPRRRNWRARGSGHGAIQRERAAARHALRAGGWLFETQSPTA